LTPLLVICKTLLSVRGSSRRIRDQPLRRSQDGPAGVTLPSWTEGRYVGVPTESEPPEQP